MNERIVKLFMESVDSNYIPVPIEDHIPSWTEKFAELIVFECVKAVMDGTKEGDHYAQRIEQHFDNGTDGVLHFGVE